MSIMMIAVWFSVSSGATVEDVICWKMLIRLGLHVRSGDEGWTQTKTDLEIKQIYPFESKLEKNSESFSKLIGSCKVKHSEYQHMV